MDYFLCGHAPHVADRRFIRQGRGVKLHGLLVLFADDENGGKVTILVRPDHCRCFLRPLNLPENPDAGLRYELRNPTTRRSRAAGSRVLTAERRMLIVDRDRFATTSKLALH